MIELTTCIMDELTAGKYTLHDLADRLEVPNELVAKALGDLMIEGRVNRFRSSSGEVVFHSAPISKRSRTV
jgi:hypothetical protein